MATALQSSMMAVLLLLHSSSAEGHHHSRRLLHHAFFTPGSIPPSEPPNTSPQPHSHKNPPQQPNYPLSSTTTANPFFPSYPSQFPPPPPASASTVLPTFPANISSLVLPQSSSPSSHSPVSPKLIIAISVFLSLLAVSLLASLALLHYRSHRRRQRFETSRPDNVRLYPPDAATSDGHPPKLRGTVTHTSSEFLYLGTLANSREFVSNPNEVSDFDDEVKSPASSLYQKLESPELHPLPPLPKQNFTQNCRKSDNDEDDEEEFFSPRGSSGGIAWSASSKREFQDAVEFENFGRKFSNSSGTDTDPASPIHDSHRIPSARSPLLDIRSRSLKSDSPENTSRSPPVISPPLKKKLSSEVRNSTYGINSPSENSDDNWSFTAKADGESMNSPPVPPPPPPPRLWESSFTARPPPLSPPSLPVVSPNNHGGSGERDDEIRKPKLKALHWDKVRASSDRATVWDQLQPSSFQLNEEMIETLFVATGSNMTATDIAQRSTLPSLNEENRVLDPRKSQNIAILLRALNVTIEEVCDALLEGNADTLGAELLESLLKMTPTEEEERKLKEYDDESSPFKLGPAEKFLSAVVRIPFAFKRIDAMVYMVNFDSEVEYLSKSFEVLEEACEELRNSRAFKLDTLLKLVDIKGSDAKTTLLHFVVHEISKAEGSRIFHGNRNPTAESPHQYSDLHDDIESRKRGLEVVAGLGGELMNVKKAAAMDSDALSRDTRKLALEISKVHEVSKLNEQLEAVESNRRLTESIEGFLRKAEGEIARIEDRERNALAKVKGLTEYFHGNSAKEEAHPLRIFMVVRDFLSILDRVCKEVGKMNERTLISSVPHFSMPTPFPELNEKQKA
ncbi:hypothetical protein Nepgr_020114 [Nepenthes gracilis]|uniref:Formin-like protein n=1 Tax=Nepenthes gracilis TaxID=150966 RepID=A0AAD3SUH1_NEPGR|nr:hypothetical protein Nepgr_020114 [Nepenthes gracilis]